MRPGIDIEVVFTGPRPGEKLREELVADFESMFPTDHPKVNRLSAGVDVTEAEVVRLAREIEAVMWDDSEDLKRRIMLVAHRYSLDGTADLAGQAAGQPRTS
jgi:FlaA1/EpsC-like NDP-sugar epimerase